MFSVDIIPTSDIYYNMADLKRSRIVVTELNDYIKGKADFASEFEVDIDIIWTKK